jgi:tetratricopeptide (TPR) repeat protein
MTILAEAELYSPRQVYWHRRLSIEMENFRAALDWGQERDVPAALQIVTALERTWEDYSIQEEMNWLKTLLARAEQLEDALSARARGWRALSDTQTWMNDIEESRRCGMKSLELARQAGDFVNEVLALESLAFCSWLTGDKTNGLVFAQQALEVSRANHDKRGEIEALYVLGMNSNDNYEYARDCYEQSLAICRELGHLLGEASRLDDLATLASRHGDYDQAYVWWQESIRVFAEAGMPNQGHLYTNLADLQIRQGDYQAAYKNLQVSIAMNREKGVTILLQWSIERMGQVLLRLGDYESAHEHFMESLHFLKRSRAIAPINSVLIIEGLASVYANVGRVAEGLAFYAWADIERQTLNDTRLPDKQAVVDADMQKIRAGLTDVEFVAAEAQGKALTREQAIALAYQGA